MLLLKVKDKEYTLRLTARHLRDLEYREKKSILSMFNKLEEISLIEPFIKIIHAALIKNHPELKLDDVYDLYDDLVEYENYNTDKLQKLVEDIMSTAGLTMGAE